MYKPESFVGLIKECCERPGLEKMTPIEHLPGAYFGVVYALQHPECVQRLTLPSPAGVAHEPNNTAPSRERQMVGEDGAEVADSSRPAVLEQERRVENKEESWRDSHLVRSSLFWGLTLVGRMYPSCVTSPLLVTPSVKCTL